MARAVHWIKLYFIIFQTVNQNLKKIIRRTRHFEMLNYYLINRLSCANSHSAAYWQYLAITVPFLDRYCILLGQYKRKENQEYIVEYADIPERSIKDNWNFFSCRKLKVSHRSETRDILILQTQHQLVPVTYIIKFLWPLYLRNHLSNQYISFPYFC